MTVYSKNEFYRNILTLMMGTTIAQAIPIAFSPILTRIYSPEDFGVFAIFIAISTIIGGIINGRYELAIMLPKKDEDAINIAALGFMITSVISLCLFIPIILFNSFFVDIIGNKFLGLWLYCIPPTVFLIGCANILTYVANRQKDYADLRTSTIVKSIVLVSIQLLIGFMKQGALGLVLGQIFSQLLFNIALQKRVMNHKNLTSKISVVKMIALGKKYKDFPKHSIPTALLDNISINTPLYILGKFFSVEAIGYYAFTYRVLQIPLGLVTSAIAQVFYQRFSSLSSYPNEQKKLLISVWLKLFMIGFFPFLCLLLYGKELFSFIFGEAWIDAGSIASYLSVMMFCMFISSPTSSAYLVLKMQKIGLVISIITLITRPLSLYFGYLYKEDILFSILCFVITETIIIIVYNLLMWIKLIWSDK